MIEKNSSILLTDQEIAELKSGVLPERLKHDWGLTLQEALAMIESGKSQGLASPDSNT